MFLTLFVKNPKSIPAFNVIDSHFNSGFLNREDADEPLTVDVPKIYGLYSATPKD